MVGDKQMTLCYSVYERYRFEVHSCQLEAGHTDKHHDGSIFWSDNDEELLCRKCGSKMDLISPGIDQCTNGKCENTEIV